MIKIKQIFHSNYPHLHKKTQKLFHKLAKNGWVLRLSPHTSNIAKLYTLAQIYTHKYIYTYTHKRLAAFRRALHIFKRGLLYFKHMQVYELSIEKPTCEQDRGIRQLDDNHFTTVAVYGKKAA